MNVQELINELEKCDPYFPVYVMNDNGCRDPGMAEALVISEHFDKWEDKMIVSIYSDKY